MCQNIHPFSKFQWEREEGENPYCGYCGKSDINTPLFLEALQHFYVNKISNYLESNELKVRSNLIKSKGIYEKLSEYKYTHFNEVHSAYNEIEKELDEIAEQKGFDIIDKQERERERERESKIGARNY